MHSLPGMILLYWAAPFLHQRCFYMRYIHTYIYSYIHTSRHTVVCQRPRKPCGTQVCYLQEPLTHCFQPLISLQTFGRFLLNSHILYPPYTQPYIPNLKEIDPVVYEIHVPENCPIFFTFFFFFAPFYKSNFEPPFPWIDFFQVWHTYKALCGLS